METQLTQSAKYIAALGAIALLAKRALATATDDTGATDTTMHDDTSIPFSAGPSNTPTGRIARAIATAEGYGASQSNIPTARNNPGDLEANGVIITFPTAQAGWDALERQIDLILSGRSHAGYKPEMSIMQIAMIYTGTQQAEWANNVASALGLTINDPLTAVA